ncbi:ribokinase [Paenibacillus albiflavus]|uniref:Ribokinase n=1 Tax=Paenibacillus albiflavus TaxID=2545760 RepID=A0A4R4ECM5_9BACL|nr:ribokinase [Paenibacillus albiflavus]TCZ77147.1 ribokinase [Paenibacillus albiflavus]
MKKICIVGSLNTDIVMQTKKFPTRGENTVGQNAVVLSGGKGGNAATAVCRLGKEAVLISSVGMDYYGETMLADLTESGINITHIKRTPLSHTGLTTIIIDESAERTMVVAPGANMQLTAQDITDHALEIQQCSVLLVQLEVAEEAVIQAMKLAKESGLLVIIDPAPAEGITMQAIRYADILIPNEQETKHMTGIEVANVDDALQAAKYFQLLGIEKSIIKMGHRGALVYTPSKWQFIEAIPVDAVDTVVGDTFSGALACSLAEGNDLFQAAWFATIVSALKVTRLGPRDGIPTMAEVEAFMKARNLQQPYLPS